MKLQMVKAWKYKGKKYSSYSVNLPGKEIEALGWKKGDDLEVRVRSLSGVRGLIVRKRPSDVAR